ncbi:MAG: aa3-type cytochrome c oxidase subunit IV [Pseudomonadota bacterium]
MTTETHEHDFEHHRVDNAVHQRDYAGFISLLKWTMVIVAIISAAVIFIISN